MTSNFDRWQLYCRDLCSPQSYVDFGFFYLISACLQRRVWLGPSHCPLYGNMYIIPCAEPGIGKGMIIKQVSHFLSFYKKTKRDPRYPDAKTHPNKKVEEATEEDFLRMQDELEKFKDVMTGKNDERDGKKINGFHKELSDDPLMYSMAPEASSYEALVKAMAESYDGHVYKTSEGKWKTYTYCSLAFCLEEISSLFRKKTEDLVNFLLVAYDCGDYTKETKTQGRDRIKSCCLNFFGGTTPSFMQETFDSKLLNEGFASRTFFLFEYANRSSEIFMKELDVEQKVAKVELLTHIKKLKRLHGQVTYTQEAADYLSTWWREFPKSPRPNSSLRLKPYYSRKNIHVQKLAMAIHFGETVDSMVINLATVKRAMMFLDKVEQRMHYALTFKSSNPLAGPGKKVIEFLRHQNKPLRFDDLLIELYDDVGKAGLEVLLSELISMKKLNSRQDDKNIVWYSLPERIEPENGNVRTREKID